ncbi:MAG: CoA transferase, partial [Comamonadaceae bacterium]
NRGKRSVALDLKSEQGRELLRTLVRRADVLTENFRPGTMDKLGIGASELMAINPRLIYCSITGYGRWGPLAPRGGFDLILQAFSGLIAVTGEAGRAPVKPGVSVADVNAGILACLGVLGAHIHQLKTGQGQHVETSLLQASMQQLYWYAALFFSGGTLPDRLGTAHPIIAPYQTFTCDDGEIALGGANEANWVRVTDVLQHPEWRTDPRFSTPRERLLHREALTDVVNAALVGRTRGQWEEAFAAAGVPVGPVQSVAEALSHPQTRAMDVVVDVDTAAGGTRPMIGFPVHFSGRNAPATAAAPRLGQHSVEVLREFGVAAGDIDRLIAAGCVRQLSQPQGENA